MCIKYWNKIKTLETIKYEQNIRMRKRHLKPYNV